MKKNSNISFKNTKIMVLKIYYYYLKNFIMKIANKGEFQEIALIIHQILTLKFLQNFTKNVLQSYILFID